MKKISLMAVCASLCCAAAGNGLVPRPVSIVKGEGVFFLNGRTQITFSSPELIPAARYLSEQLPGLGILPVSPVAGNSVCLSVCPAGDLPPEGYRLSVTPGRAEIRGSDYAGVFNGIQTFLQLLPPEVCRKDSVKRDIPVECVEIADWPRFGYRGFMLDAARTFIPTERLLKVIDDLARHKINKLHLHLTDDEGWRIEIKSYPELTAVGGFRGGDSPVRAIYGSWDSKYGGYYTQDEMRGIVEYAAARNIEIIPEIELPGHSMAAALSYPEILCDYVPDLTVSAGYDCRDVWCAAKEGNYAMIETIIGELSEIFPSRYIHIGGDEVGTGQWSQCPDCKALMAAHDTGDPIRLEDIFMERVVEILRARGKTAGVWNEAAGSGRLDRSSVVYSWENTAACRKAAAAGYPTVAVPGKYFYFDMRQSQNETGHTWAGIVSPRTVYSFDLAKEGFTEAETENVLGLEATFFSELLLSNGPDFLNYQLWPRMCAFAEAAWTPQAGRSWEDFERRLRDSHYARLQAMGIMYRTEPAAATGKRAAAKTPAVGFTSSLKASAKFPFSNIPAYKNSARTTATCRTDDWFLFEFAVPVACDSIRVATGYAHLPRAGVPSGRVELSYDGKTFTEAARLDEKLAATLYPDKPVKAVRIVSERDGNGEPFVIIQSLDIR